MKMSIHSQFDGDGGQCLADGEEKIGKVGQ